MYKRRCCGLCRRLYMPLYANLFPWDSELLPWADHGAFNAVGTLQGFYGGAVALCYAVKCIA